MLPGNIEHFIGVAQVPIGIAGPLLVNGEHAQGEFYVPMATAEGTLVASYNRGMKLLHAAGGVTTTILDDRMQRAPVVPLRRAPARRATFGEWLDEHFDEIKAAAEATTRSGKLQDIEQYSGQPDPLHALQLHDRRRRRARTSPARRRRPRATGSVEHYPGIEQFFLESNFATDKKSSQINMLRTRGKRVVAEATIPDALLKQRMSSGTELMYRARQVSNLGGFMSGVNNNGAHSANGITAMFIATGQDVANVAESSAGFVYAELRAERRLLLLDHDPVADRRRPTAAARGSRRSASAWSCSAATAAGKVRKFAEIVAATVLCGELSLGSAIVAEEWVDAHDLYGRNRPDRSTGASAPSPRGEPAGEREQRVVAPVDHALLQRDDRVVGDVDALRADLGAALGDVAQAEAALVRDEVRAGRAVSSGCISRLAMRTRKRGPK